MEMALELRVFELEHQGRVPKEMCFKAKRMKDRGVEAMVVVVVVEEEEGGEGVYGVKCGDGIVLV